MRTLLAVLEAAAVRRPRSVLAALAAVTAGMVALATAVEVEVDLTQLGSEESEAVAAMERVREEFADPTATVQVVLDAGRDGNMLTRNGLEAIRAAEAVTVDALGSAVRTDEEGGPQVLSLASPVTAALAQQGLDPGTADEAQIGALAGRLAAASPQLSGLVSDDFDPDEHSARATVLVALLDQDLSEPERTEAGERVRAAFDARQEGVLADLGVTVFSSGLFVDGLLDAIRAEVPLLFGLALLVVLAILALMYRSAFDVGVGLLGLLATVAWTLGLAALLGPAHLGWTGPLTQLVVVIPVLLVGLGIDYSVHLTARYREQRAAGHPPADAAGRALHTVGGALVLATAATAVGFASIASAPLGMLADFGVFVAAGVVGAFLIMGLLVPAARVWRDTRKAVVEPAAGGGLRLSGLMRGPVWLARHAPAAGLAVAAVAVGASLLATTRLEIQFDRDDFIPEGSHIQEVLAHQDELFGGGVTESTYVVVDGELTDPAVINALWHAEASVGDIQGVRTVDGTPQVLSVASLAATVLDPAGGPSPGPALQSPVPPAVPRQDDGPSPVPPADAWTADGFAGNADLETVYDALRQAVGEQRLRQVLAADARAATVHVRTTAGDAGAERLQQEMQVAFAPVQRAGATVTVTSEPIIIAEMSEDLGAFQARAIVMTLAIVLALLTANYALARRRWLLGAIALLPAVVSASLILGTMWFLAISFNVLTATLTAIAIGIGVPYGVHVVNRFAENLATASAGDAVATTLHATGAALTGSALTTLGAFVVLAFSDLPPMRSLGLLGGTGIAFALLAAVLVEPGALVLWGRHRDRRSADSAKLVASSTHPDVSEPVA